MRATLAEATEYFFEGGRALERGVVKLHEAGNAFSKLHSYLNSVVSSMYLPFLSANLIRKKYQIYRYRSCNSSDKKKQ